MGQLRRSLFVAAAAACAASQIGLAFQSSPPVIKVCSLLPREEVKKLIGGELYVKVGPRWLTLQRSVGMGQTVASVRPGVIDLAKALVAKLR